MVGKIAIAVLVLGGLVAGALIGGVVSGTQPALLGWLFGAGAGLMGGAFIAALVTNEALVGRGSSGPRSVSYPGETPPRRADEDEDA